MWRRCRPCESVARTPPTCGATQAKPSCPCCLRGQRASTSARSVSSASIRPPPSHCRRSRSPLGPTACRSQSRQDPSASDSTTKRSSLIRALQLGRDSPTGWTMSSRDDSTPVTASRIARLARLRCGCNRSTRAVVPRALHRREQLAHPLRHTQARTGTQPLRMQAQAGKRAVGRHRHGR